MTGETNNATALAGPAATDAEPGPKPVITHFDRIAWLSFVTAALGALAGYAATISPNVTLAFSGIASTGAYYAGVPHPPGYPVWTLYSWCVINLLPFSNIAWRVAMGSAVASALACGLVAFMVARGGLTLFRRDHSAFASPESREFSRLRFSCGAVAGLVLAFSGNVWRFAVGAEMQAVSLMLFVAALCMFFQWSLAPNRKPYLISAFLFLGLLFTNSQEYIVALSGLFGAILLVAPKTGRDVTLFVLPIAIVATSRNQWRLWIDGQFNLPLFTTLCLTGLAAVALAIARREIGSEWKCAMGCGLAFLLGLGFYLYVPLASMSTPPVNWGYPRTTDGFWHVIGRGQYETMRPTDELNLVGLQLWTFLKMTGRQFGWLPLAVSLLPLVCIGFLAVSSRRSLAGLAVIGFCVSIVMIIELNPPLDRQAREFTGQYFAAAHAILALGLGLGLTIVGAKFANPGSSRSPSAQST